MLALPTPRARHAPPVRHPLFLLVAGWLLFTSQTAWSQSLLPNLIPTLNRVEEDWELQLMEPDSTLTAPQITCSMAVGPTVEGIYATFELNHQTQPAFEVGGLHVHLWNGDVVRASRSQDNRDSLRTSGEVIRWTQAMYVSGGNLVFDISNGTSTTWGTFGQGGQLRVSIVTSLTNLNPYDPETSIANSSVGYASNRVRKLVLKRVRLYTSDQQVWEDSTERIAHQLQ